MKRNALTRLNEWKHHPHRKPLLLYGARQVGKTWLLQEFGRTAFANTHYVNFEADGTFMRLFENDLDPNRVINDLGLYLSTPVNPETDLLVFDEIQLCPRALTALKYFNEQLPGMAVCSAGSLIGIHMGAGSYPVGKVDILPLYPMTFDEFLTALGEERLAVMVTAGTVPVPAILHRKLWDLWKRYLAVGGLPEVVDTYRQLRDNEYEALERMRTVQLHLTGGYLADIAKHCGKINAMHIERLWESIPGQLARSQDGTTAKFRFKDAVPGLRGYNQLAGPLDWLETAGMVVRTSLVGSVEQPWAAHARDNSFKLYVFDTGILCALSGLAPAEVLGYDSFRYKGYLVENFVAQELTAHGIGRLYSWHGRTSEIEFLLPRAGAAIPIEVKAGRNTKSKSLNVFESNYSPHTAYVLSEKNSGKKGIRIYMPVYMAAAVTGSASV